MTDPLINDTSGGAPRTGAEIVGRKLADAGCRRAFGIPGGEVLAAMGALEAAGVQFTLTKHENAAGFMAEGAWHADSGDGPAAAPGVLIATIGPGLANAVNVIVNALQDRAPMIVLSGCVDAAEAHSYTHQVFDQQALMRPIVKASLRADPGAIGVVMDKAIALATSGQQGPVHVDLPIGAMEGPPVGRDAAPFAPPPPSAAPAAPSPSPALDLAKERFQAAVRPIALLGVDAVNAGAGAVLSDFCRTHQIPAIASYKAKGLLDDADPLALGGAGLSPKADAILHPLLAEADLILALGYDPIEMRIGWRRPWPTNTPFIEIAPSLRDHGMHPNPSASFQTDLAASLAALADGAPARRRWPGGEIAAAKAALTAAFAPETDWGPARVFHILRELAPPETVATADSGAHRILLSQIWRCPTPRTLLQSSALCTMGCAIPLAMGHALAEPDTPVLAFVGDAGLEMGLGELATLRDLKLPVVIATLVDESLALIEKKQRESQRANLGVDFGASDFPAIAQAMGGVGVWIEDADGLRREVPAAFSRETFTLLAIRIGRRAYDGKL